MKILSRFIEKLSSLSVEAPAEVNEFTALDSIVRNNPDVAERRKAMDTVVQRARSFRLGLDGMSANSKLVYAMASQIDSRELDATTELGKLAKGIRRASIIMFPATKDTDAGVRCRAFSGLGESAASTMVNSDFIARYLGKGLKDSDLSARIAAATSLGEFLGACAGASEPVCDAVVALLDCVDDPDPDFHEAVIAALRRGRGCVPQEALEASSPEGEIWRRGAALIPEWRVPPPSEPEIASLPVTVPSGGTSFSEAEAVEALLSIYTDNPDGFAPGYGDPGARAKVREIGEALNRQAGMELMLRVHTEFARSTHVFGAPRNLEHTWDQIGDWRG
jgi:hypothetical protein